MKTLGTYYTYFAFSGTNTPNQYTAGGVTYMNDVRFRFIVKEDVNTTNNKSTIEVDKYVNYINNLGGGSTLDFTLYSIVNGSSKASTKNNVSPGSTTSSWTFVGTSEYDIDHEDDGSGSITFNGRGYYVGGSGTAYNTYTGTKTIKLTKIDRASTITNNTTSGSRKDFGVNVTFSIDRPSSSTKHTLTYKVGSTTYTIGSGITTSKTYAFPTSLISKFTSTATPNITVTCKSSNGTSSSTTVYLKVPNTYVPTCSLSLTDAMNNKPSSLSGLWIKNKSLLKGTITASGIAGSTIKSYLSTVSGSSTNYNTNPFTTTALSNSGEMTVTSKVTDTRGRTNTDTETINVIDYDNPAFITAKVERCNSDGTLNELGTYGKVTCKYKIYPINNGTTNLNTKSLTVKMGGGTPQEIPLTNFEDTVTAVLFSDISNNNSYQFTFTLTDIFGPQTQTFSLGIAYVTESKRAGGKGISFGQIASEDGFAVHMPIVQTTEWLNATYPVGSVYISNTNENPSSRLGGTWELIDKEFKSYGVNNKAFFTPNSNVSSHDCWLIRAGHTIRIRLQFTTAVEITDAGADIGDFNYSLIGIERTNISSANIVAGTDNGNCAFLYTINHSTGNVFIGDAVGRDSLPADSSCYIDFTIPIQQNYMLDSACDKFYWKRTA